jgi:hypothetical protein
MPFLRFVALNTIVVTLASALAWPQTPPAASPPLVLAGGTVVDVTAWGQSAHDLEDAVVIVREGRVAEVGPAASTPIPKGARVIDCKGKYLIPGLVDGFAGMNSQAQANANLYMGITTVVASTDAQRGPADLAANPSPHLYLIDSIGTTDNWSLLARRPEWAERLREGPRPTELTPEETARQMADTARLGTRALYLGANITAANTQWIVAHAHKLGLATYGAFAATPYKVGIEAGVDALLHMSRYPLGAIPNELQRPLVTDPTGTAASTAYDYSERIPPTDAHLHTYAKLIASHHAALMPTFSLFYAELPDHRNLWKEPAAHLADPSHMDQPSNPATGELTYPLPSWTHRLPSTGQRWMEESLRKKAEQRALRLWRVNQTLFAAFPHYLAASGAGSRGSMPGISLHTELELLVRMGLSPREALAAATNNYALEFGWNELGLIAAGRRADILILDADPTANVWNARRINTLVVDGNLVDREGLLRLRR